MKLKILYKESIAEERISDWEDRKLEITATEQNKEER